MELTIPITERARKYGYIFWSAQMDNEVVKFFGKKGQIGFWFEGSYLGVKRIDFQHRRISIGPRQGRNIGKRKTEFHYTYREDGSLNVVCK